MILSVNDKLSKNTPYTSTIASVTNFTFFNIAANTSDNPQPSAGFGEGVGLCILRNGEPYKLIMHGDGHFSVVAPYGTKTY